jgi:predicted ester cyclase
MSRQANEACLRQHLAAENAHDIEATVATLDPDCVFVDEPLGLTFTGRAGAREHYGMWWSAFGNTVERGRLHWVDDDLLIGEAVFVGRHVGPFAGIAATGARLELPFVVFVTFRNGLLGGERFVYDLNGLLRQLGQPCFEPLTAVNPMRPPAEPA